MDLESAMESFDDPRARIVDRVGLAKFVGELHADLVANPADWENVTLERYLEAMHAWLTDMGGVEKNLGIDFEAMPKWAFVAHALLAAKAYE